MNRIGYADGSEVAHLNADGEWVSGLPGMGDMLDALYSPFDREAHDPAPFLHAATEAAEELNLELIESDIPQHVEGRIY